MLYAIPLCVQCQEYEVGTFAGGSTEFCSSKCQSEALQEDEPPTAETMEQMGIYFTRIYPDHKRLPRKRTRR